MSSFTSAFALPDRLAAKADASLIAEDERHFAELADSLDRTVSELTGRFDAVRRAPARTGQDALERDLEVHRITGRLRAMRRFGLDACLGRMVPAGGGESVYVGRFGLADESGNRLLVDWRTPAAEPFFAATHAHPSGLYSRRRYRFTRGRISDYWDEVFTPEGREGHAALDDQSAFIASLGESRSTRMREVLGTIQADQDAIIRATSRGALVVDGGPGTGKTVVALHRTAYLLYADSRLDRGGVLFVGPHEGYLAYVDDVLPSLGEEGVATCTIRDLVTEGASATGEIDPAVALLKSSVRMVDVIEAATGRYERPPSHGMTVETPWGDIRLSAADWAEAFGSQDGSVPHNDAREEVWDYLVEILAETLEGRVPVETLTRTLRDSELRETFVKAWPLLDPAGLVADLWSVPGLLTRCAPWLSVEQVDALRRTDARAWTESDLPLLDAARYRIGDPSASRRARDRAAAVACQREQFGQVIDNLIQAEEHDDGEGLMTMLRGQDVQNSLIDDAGLPEVEVDQLAGPFAHIVVDEAQELTDAQWLMLARRCPSGSVTVVGDRAQARRGFTESWSDRLRRVGFGQVNLATLSINYRTPAEVMAEAEPVIRRAIPDANVPVSIRETGVPVRHGALVEVADIVAEWLARNDDGIACVIANAHASVSLPESDGRVRRLTPERAKGLEFDLVVLIDPERFGVGVTGAVDRYVAMTRATSELVILTA